MSRTLKDKILLKRSDAEKTIIDNVSDLLFGETVLCYENGKERLYCKNSDGEIVPIHKNIDAGEIERVPYYLPEEAPKGVYVYANDGLLYIPDLWNIEDNEKAVGVAVVQNDGGKWCIKKDLGAKNAIPWSIALSTTDVPEIYNYSMGDYNGLNNSIAIRNSSPEENESNNSAWYCYSQTIEINGNAVHGYLHGWGELRDTYYNKEEVENTLTLIGSDTIADLYNGQPRLWSSTESDSPNETDYAYTIWWKDGDYTNANKALTRNEQFTLPFFPILPTLVDLGLPSGTLWAKTNIGANHEDEAGLYFQWGDTIGYTAEQLEEGEKEFASDWSDYKFGTSGAFTKYNSSDGKAVLDLEDDAAHVMLGEGLQMPTDDDFVNLCMYTNMYIILTSGEEIIVTETDDPYIQYYFTFAKANEAKALKFYNKSDHSKYIIIPFVGYINDGSIQNNGTVCGIFGSSIGRWNAIDNGAILECNITYGSGQVSSFNRCNGFPIRPIYKH